MKQRFFTTTIQSNFIKSLIYNTPVPLVDTVNNDSYIIKDNIYIYRGKIIKCTKSGIVKMPDLPRFYTCVYKNGDLRTSFDSDAYNTQILSTLNITHNGNSNEYFINIEYVLGNNVVSESAGTINNWEVDTSFSMDGGDIENWSEPEPSESFDGGSIFPWSGLLPIQDYTPTDGDIIEVYIGWEIIESSNYYFYINGKKYEIDSDITSVNEYAFTSVSDPDNPSTAQKYPVYRNQYFKYIASTNSWVYIGFKLPSIKANNTYVEGMNYHPIVKSEYDVLDNFYFGKYYPSFTELFMSKYSYYDSETHEHLGNLLRCYRDIYGINLMPYYNCFSGNYVSGMVIKDDGVEVEDSSEFKILRIPIKFNTTYTIAIDCISEVKVSPVLLSNNHIIEMYDGNDLTQDLYNGNISYFDSLSFKEPVRVGVDIIGKSTEKMLYKYQKYLCLLIQLPASSDSSIVVLEGDYSKYRNNDYSFFSIDGVDELTDLELSKILTSDLSLLQMNDKVSYPFANRLIEYLLLNVITSREIITQNIGRVQEKFVDYEQIPEVWSNRLRTDVYNQYQRTGVMKRLDLNGFVDKDTEKAMR